VSTPLIPRHVRDLISYADSLSIRAVPSQRKNNHWQLCLTNERGDSYNMIIGSSISDHLAVLNNQALIKRFARGVIHEYTRK
jgi:hypothetical protein